MRVLISDYQEQMEPDYAMTISALRKICPEAEVTVEPYGTEAFYEALGTAEGLITAFLPVDQGLLERAPKLRAISQNAIGYSNCEVDALQGRGIALCHIVEYCTREVSEHAIALMLALNRNLPQYAASIREEHRWNFRDGSDHPTLDHRTLAIFGLGRIGASTASLAKALGMEVLAVDPFVPEERASALGVKLVTKEDAFARADVIINHMALTRENYHCFDAQAFAQMARHPIFINVGRGGYVDEAALLDALEQRQISAAGLDVLEDENPDLANCPFVGRRDVILTPHCGFYSSDSIRKLHEISGRNMGYLLRGEPEKAEGLVCG